MHYLEQPQPNRGEHPRLRGLAPASVKKALAPVKAMFADALDEGLIRSHPATGLRIAGVSRQAADAIDDEPDNEGEVKALTEEQLKAILAALPEDWRFFFVFLAMTALRIGEAIEVRWRDVDLGEGTLTVRRQFSRGKVGKPKGRKTRTIRLSPDLQKALWRLRKETRAVDDELVFTAERGGRINSSNLMSRILKPATVPAGIGETVKTPKGERAESWVGFHTFRHSCATLLFLSGWNAAQVCMFLGHADPGFTLRTYVHLLPKDLPEPAFLDAITAPAGGSKVATRPDENRLDPEAAEGPQTRMVPGVTRPDEKLAANS